MGARFQIGPFACVLLVDGHGPLPTDVAFATAPDEEVHEALGGAHEIDAPYQCLLLRSSTELVLVDTGLGPYDHPIGGQGGELEAALGAEGVTTRDIDLVVVTHGHLDHIGGLCADGRPRFARARHVVSRIEWELWTDEQVSAQLPPAAATVAREQLPPLKESGLLELVEAPAEPAPGVRLLAAPGHSPGQLAVEIGMDVAGGLYLADVITHELHAEHPGWLMAIEPDRETVIETRRSLLGRAADENLLVAASHISAPSLVERRGDGFALRPVGA